MMLRSSATIISQCSGRESVYALRAMSQISFSWLKTEGRPPRRRYRERHERPCGIQSTGAKFTASAHVKPCENPA